MKSILVVAAHPDDEVLGCGGSIARHIDNGDSVSVIFMTNGVSARCGSGDKESIIRQQSATSALNILGVSSIFFEDCPDNMMDKLSLIEVVKKVELVINKVNPEIIYTHFSDDLNIDHRITHQAVMTACRPQCAYSVKEIYCFEVPSSTEWNSYSSHKFNPNFFVDISDFWSKKEKALLEYKEEMRAFPHSRSIKAIEALAILRGANVGLEKAESFQIERIIK
ncbi:PIG-L family deacetylase [Moritella sp. 24]|uniref:PIG-L deacetylase family protein n=1 Tax=Moritella sp. 24 TaxID=2746230 RepID=UPI001BEE2C78|nr:PIG-L family deacetylase [Moritella sp. 24]QUM77850.1 PIG-L family deacetylase [Moritella sp. 24]